MYHSLLGYHVSGRHGAITVAAATLHDFLVSHEHAAWLLLTIYFLPILHYMLASFNLISLQWTVVVGSVEWQLH